MADVSSTELLSIPEYRKFVRTKPEKLEEYLIYKIPFPSPTECFDPEAYELDSPTMLEIKSWEPSMRSYLIRNVIGSVVIAVFMGIIFHLLGIQIEPLFVILTVFILLAVTCLGGFLSLSRYQKNAEVAQSESVRSSVFSSHLVLWALSRYDFESEEDFEDLLKNECYLAKTGILAGRIVVSKTGEEWPLNRL